MTRPLTFMALYDNLVAAWRLEEVSGTRVDETARGNNLTDNNTVTQATGKLGNAAQFTEANSEFLSLTSTADVQLGDIDWTIALWVYLDAASLSGVHFFVGKDTNTSGGRDYDIGINSSSRFICNVYAPTDGEIQVAATSFGAPTVSTWYCVFAWHDASANTVNICVNNGTVDSVATGGSLQAASATEFRLGSRAYPSFQSYFSGRLDAVHIWKRVLTSGDRAEFYNSGAGVEFSAAATSVGPALFRGRNFPFFDDDQVNRFEFWPAVTVAPILTVPVATVAVSVIAPSVSRSPVTLSVPVAAVSTSAVAPQIAKGTRTLTVPAISVGASVTTPLVALTAITRTVPIATATVTVTAPARSLGSVSLTVPVAVIATTAMVPALRRSIGVPSISVSTTVSVPQVGHAAVTLNVPVVQVGATVTAPAVAVGASTISVPTVSISVTVVAPVVNVSVITRSVPVVSCSSTVTVPQVVLGVVSTAIPIIPVTATATSPTITVTSTSLTVPSINVAVSVSSPLVSANGLVQVGSIIVASSVTAPQVSLGSLNVSVSVISVTVSAASPSFGLGPVALIAPISTVTISVVAPDVSIGISDITLSVPVVTISVMVIPPVARGPVIPDHVFVVDTEQGIIRISRESKAFFISNEVRKEIIL